MSHGKTLCRVCGALIEQCRCMDHKKEVSYGVCLSCASKDTDAKKFGVRLYGNFLTNGSFGRVSRGLEEGLKELGLLAGCVEVDVSCSDELELAPGSDAAIGIYAGNPSFVMVMTSHGVHSDNFVILAPNSTWLPDRLITSLRRHAKVVAPSSWGAEIVARYTEQVLPPLRHGVSRGFGPKGSLGASLLSSYERDGQFRVLHLASTDKQRKGTRELIAAWRSLVSNGRLGNHPHLEIVVDAPSGTYPDAEGEPTIGMSFRRLNATVEQMSDLYQQFHVVCQPSRAEGFGLCPLEALGCGVPIVASGCTGHHDYLTDQLAGAVAVATGSPSPIDDGPEAMAPSLDEKDIALALTKAYDQWTSLFSDARENASVVRSHWSWANQTKLWLQAMGFVT